MAEEYKAESTIRELNARLALLEKFVRGSEEVSTQQPLVDQTNSVHQELSEILKANPQIGKFVDNFTNLKSLTQPSNLLSTEAKLEIVLASEGHLREQQKSLDSIQQNEKFINSENFAISKSFKSQLAPLEASILGDVEKTVQQTERFEKLLLSYNEIINTLSEKFVYYDELLNSIESKLDK